MPTEPRCPKCAGRLFVDRDADGLVPLASELACLACGWRRVVTLAETGLFPPRTGHDPRMHGARRHG